VAIEKDFWGGKGKVAMVMSKKTVQDKMKNLKKTHPRRIVVPASKNEARGKG